jgi:hypothetical protein
VRLEEEDSSETVEGFDFALVSDPDTDNLRGQRAGMKASLKAAETLANYQEARLRRLHLTLNRYLAG